MSLRDQALQILLICDPHDKALAARAAHQLAQETAQEATGKAAVPALSEADRQAQLALTAEQAAIMPGRPARPLLVSATQVPSRSPFTLEGRAALLHAICHIEFNAIKLKMK